MFTKVKAAAISAALVILAALAAWAADFPWGDLGAWGPIISTAVPVIVAYLVKELRGYGAGVPKPDDVIPRPLPTGAAGEPPQ